MPPRRPETSDNDFHGLGLGYGQHGAARTLGDGHRDPIGLSPLVPPTLPFASGGSGGGGGNSSSGSTGGGGSPVSSRRSSMAAGSDVPFRGGHTRPFSTSSSIGSDFVPGTKNNAANNVSLSINYLPSKYTQLHEPGQYAHRRGSFFSRTSIADDAIDNKDDLPLATGESLPPVSTSEPTTTGTGNRFSRLLPNKFTSSLAPQLAHKTVPRGGGRQAFASDAGRMGGEEEEGDELIGAPTTNNGTDPHNRSDGLRQRHVPSSAAAAGGDTADTLLPTAGQGVRFTGQSTSLTGLGGKNGGKPRLVWNRFKWCIFFANLLVRPIPSARIFRCQTQETR